MRNETKKYTVKDPMYIGKALEAFCDKEPHYNVLIKDISVRFRTKSEEKINGLKEKGYDLDIKTKYTNKAKKIISTIPIEITAIDKAKAKKDYTKGIQINITFAGETRKELQKDIDRREGIFYKYLNEYGIPLDRVCIESSLQCEYKLSNVSCATVN